MNEKQNIGGAEGRRGVALIVVLGFLSIMIVMAVAFLTHARTERMVAAATMEGMRGRQLLRTGLNAAMNDYSVALQDAKLVTPVGPDEVMFTSLPPNSATDMNRVIGQDRVELLVGEAFDWIPRRFTNAPYLAMETVADRAEWVLVREDPSDARSRILGRYAYVCFDMSGGIDANMIALDSEIANNDARVASNRLRRSARQLPMRMLPETANASEFKKLRRGWKGFDSLQSMINLTDGRYIDGQQGFESGDSPSYGQKPSNIRWFDPDRLENSPALHSNLVSDLVPFSLSAYRGGRYNQGSGLWDAPVLIRGNTDWGDALDPVSEQFASGWGNWISDAINDYTNNSQVPVGTDYPSPKNVPMFNEFGGTYQLTETPNGDGTSAYSLEVRLNFEFWYPFPASNNVGGSFTLPAPGIGGGVETTGPNELWFRILPVLDTTNVIALVFGSATPSPSSLAVDADYNGGLPYTPQPASNFTYTVQLAPAPSSTAPGIPSGKTIRFQSINVAQPIYLTGTGGNADMIPTGASFPGLALGNGQMGTFSLAATDPRLNHLTGEWVVETPTLRRLNTWNASARAKFQAEGTNFYCRNAPMETPAELGFISTGVAWETIDLCTEEGADLLAGLVSDTNLFYTATAGSNTWASDVFYTNGTISPNTRSSNVLASAFVDLSTHEVPNVSTAVNAANPLDEERAYHLAAGILAETADGTIENSFQAGSDWARVPAMRKNGSLWSGYGLNNNQRESLIRNTWGLFSPGNSMFTALVVAQAIKEGPVGVGVWNADDDIITGERRAVALVWRDPYKTGQNLHHEMFVRMFRYLND